MLPTTRNKVKEKIIAMKKVSIHPREKTVVLSLVCCHYRLTSPPMSLVCLWRVTVQWFVYSAQYVLK